MNILDHQLYARYKKRTPDPGICTVNSIDWNKRRVSMSSIAFRFYPDFDEVEMVDDVAECFLCHKLTDKYTLWITPENPLCHACSEEQLTAEAHKERTGLTSYKEKKDGEEFISTAGPVAPPTGRLLSR